MHSSLSNQHPIRTALIGFGTSGQKFHAPFLKSLPAFKVTHVASSREAEVRQVFEDAAIVVVPQDQVGLIFANPDVDLVIITTPNATHYDLAKKALLNGKNVVVEKPFVLEVDQGQELIDLAKTRGLLLTVYANRRWDSDFLTVQSLLKQKALGEVFSFRARFDRYRPVVRSARWKESAEAGSGTLWDLGPHLIDQALVLFGMPSSVFAEAFPQRPGALAVDYFDIRLSYSSGLRVQLSSSSLVLSPGPKYEVHGTEVSLVKCGMDPQEQALMKGVSPFSKNFGVEDPQDEARLFLMKDGRLVLETHPSEVGNYCRFFVELANCLTQKSAPPVSAQEGLNVVKIIQACLESAGQKREISLG